MAFSFGGKHSTPTPTKKAAATTSPFRRGKNAAVKKPAAVKTSGRGNKEEREWGGVNYGYSIEDLGGAEALKKGREAAYGGTRHGMDRVDQNQYNRSVAAQKKMAEDPEFAAFKKKQKDDRGGWGGLPGRLGKAAKQVGGDIVHTAKDIVTDPKVQMGAAIIGTAGLAGGAFGAAGAMGGGGLVGGAAGPGGVFSAGAGTLVGAGASAGTAASLSAAAGGALSAFGGPGAAVNSATGFSSPGTFGGSMASGSGGGLSSIFGGGTENMGVMDFLGSDLGSSLISGGLDLYGQSQQQDAINEGFDKQNPWAAMGGADKAGGTLMELMDDPNRIADTPGYKFALEQGEKALRRKHAAQGSRLGGRALTESMQLGQGLASQMWNQEMNRYAGLAGANQAISGGTAAGESLAQIQDARYSNLGYNFQNIFRSY